MTTYLIPSVYPSQSFKQMYRDASKEFSRKVYDYMKKLHSTTVDRPGGGPGLGLDPLEIKLDSDGFPIVLSPASWNKISKDQLEKCIGHICPFTIVC